MYIFKLVAVISQRTQKNTHTMSQRPPLLFFTHSRHLLRRHHHRKPPLRHRHNHTLTHPIYTIWAANTGLGKTLISTGITAATLTTHKKLTYIKPLQTGFPFDSDAAFLFNKIPQIFKHRNLKTILKTSNETLNISKHAESTSNAGFGFYEEGKVGEGLGGLELVCKTMYAWKEAISPHLAAEREGMGVGDSEVLELLKKCLEIGIGEGNGKGGVLCLVETAGGVASPGASGSLQCDLYRPFRLPSVLVGDGRLGGISGTISAYESLIIRGYDVVAIVLEDHGLENEVPLRSYLRNKVPVLVLPSIPKDPLDNLMEWFDESQSVFVSLKDIMLSSHKKRMERLHEMPKKAQEIFWWPFTQHKFVPEEKVTVIDSRCGENFAVHKAAKDDGSITQMFDACASWWTQGPNAALQVKLARDIGYTAARYGHVMFPENVYEPALECAELLLEGVGKGWASRAYFSDNGSTAIEIALKMAFRKFLVDNELLLNIPQDNTLKNSIELKVVALRGSYHGDTLGAMDAQAPSPYTGFLQQPWYTGRGFFLDPPLVSMSDGVWKIAVPREMHDEGAILEDMSFDSRDQVFSKSRDDSSLASVYRTHISQELLLSSGSRKFSYAGALIIEPVIQGAGGMLMVDPLFQRLLVGECKKRKIPVIFDEVLTGYWRLGVESAAELLSCQPDIACYAKLMTGGMIPLAATLATNDVFESFVGDSKLKALLHGHSYSAHALGCAAACNSIKWFKDPQTNPNLVSEQNILTELWDTELVRKISFHPAVQRVVSLGTIFAVELEVNDDEAGYASLCATSLLQKLRDDGIYMRPLGNVIYMMCGPCTSPQVCLQMLETFYTRLEEFGNEKIHEVREIQS